MAASSMDVSVCGTHVHCESDGDNNAPKILLLHGWGCDISVMRPVAEQLSSRFHILSIDFPGHGLSGQPPEPWGVPEFAKCVSDVLKYLKFYPCAVIAHSFGCRVAAMMAVSENNMITKMIWTGAAGIKQQLSDNARKKQAKYHRMKKIYETIGKARIFSSYSDHMLSRLLKKYGSSDYSSLNDEMRRTFVKVVNLDLIELYPQIQQSVLLIWGENDTDTPLWMGKKMDQLISDSGLVVFENADHFAYLEQLPRFIVIVNKFLEQEH